MTLVGMTLAGSMILVDQTAVPLATAHAVAAVHGSDGSGAWILTANILPLAAFMVVGGQLGDRFGLKRVFLLGAVVFAVATTVAGLSSSMPMLLSARVVQGVGAALMMPTSVAIVGRVYPPERSGSALGVLAGGTAFFAALGPVLGGLLTAIDWRLVFLVNVPIAAAAIVLTLRWTPDLEPSTVGRGIDAPGVLSFGLGLAALVYGLGLIAGDGLTAPSVLVPLGLAVACLAAFVVIERRTREPMLDFRLLGRRNLLGATISQALAGSIELGLGFLLPFFYLLAIGISPQAAGIALLPSTIPVILAGPLAGRAFDRVGGRVPLVVGFAVLAASGVALSLAAGALSVWALVPGLLLQGFGLGVVLTVNDPTGLTAVGPEDQGEAAGMLNTAEQLGGAIGIALLGAVELSWSRSFLVDRLEARGVVVTSAEADEFHRFILDAEQAGLNGTPQDSPVVQAAIADSVAGRVESFELTFLATSVIALVGVVAALLLVRGTGPSGVRVFGRRSRWVLAHPGASVALTRRPPSPPDASP
jgi:EmrB/QacA subfamily drug resistance transporter